MLIGLAIAAQTLETNWVGVALAALNVVQTIALAYLAARARGGGHS